MKSQSVTPKADADLAKWCEALTTSAVGEEVPEGWLTTTQLAHKLNKAPSTMGKILYDAVRAGRCQRKNFRVPCGAHTRSIPHYRPT